LNKFRKGIDLTMKSKFFLLGLLIALTASGCMGDADLAQERASRAAKANGDILVGVAWPFSTTSTMFNQGIEMAVEEINAGGGIKGRKIQTLQLDDASSVTKGMAIAQSFAENLDMVAVIGHGNSYVSIPNAAIYDKAGLVMLNPAATSPNLTQMGYKRVFRLIPSDDKIGQEMAKYAADQGLKRIVILYADDDYGRGLANSFEDQATEKGMMIVDRRSYFGDTKAFKKLVETWKMLNYDAIFIADVMPRGAELIVQARAAGAEMPIMGGDGLDTAKLWEIGGKSTEDTVVASIFNPKDPRPEVQQFIAEYQKKYGIAPDRGAARGYDAVKLLAYAINQAGSTVPDQIAQVLHGTKRWPGVTGWHTFDENGEILDKAVGKKIMKSGQFEYLTVQ